MSFVFWSTAVTRLKLAEISGHFAIQLSVPSINEMHFSLCIQWRPFYDPREAFSNPELWSWKILNASSFGARSTSTVSRNPSLLERELFAEGLDILLNLLQPNTLLLSTGARADYRPQILSNTAY
jgi:hypothetical protein